MTFDQAFDRLLAHEGGWVNDSRDAGGETKFGISARSYPGENIAALTLDRAKTIYKRDFWGPAGCDAVPAALKFDLFDMAVNAGVKTSIRCLQAAVGEDEDGVLGPRTLQAVQSASVGIVLSRFNGLRLRKLTDHPQWAAFGKGWARRVAANLQGADQ